MTDASAASSGFAASLLEQLTIDAVAASAGVSQVLVTPSRSYTLRDPDVAPWNLTYDGVPQLINTVSDVGGDIELVPDVAPSSGETVAVQFAAPPATVVADDGGLMISTSGQTTVA